jgi:glyoxalase family protein
MASDARDCLNFYQGVLGMRLVKRTVNFDDPGTWHLYFGDSAGSPGTILTFFPIPGLPRGRAGLRQVTAIRLAVRPQSLPQWMDRIRTRTAAQGWAIATVDSDGPPPAAHRTVGLAAAPVPLPTGETALRVYDTDGLALDLVEAPYVTGEGIAGVDSVLIEVEGFQRTSEVLLKHLGFRLEEQVGSIFRHSGHPAGLGTVVDVKCLPGGIRGNAGAGTVHHVAFRAATEADQKSLQMEISGAGFNVTPVLDRNYFRSIYFREPGGVLFEIATDAPGFATDESPETLGTALRLPPELESRRAVIESVLPPLDSTSA